MLDVCLFYLKFIMSMFLEMIMLLRNKRGMLFYFCLIMFFVIVLDFIRKRKR